jgi:uncharacterized protein (TIGR02647 family)
MPTLSSPEAVNADLGAELELLLKFDLGSAFTGLKLHTNAGARSQDAARRLYGKGLISQPDGGYLTTRGWQAAEHAQALMLILKPPAAG